VTGVQTCALPISAAARPATRMVLGSEPYQRAFIKPRVPKPSIVTRAARDIATAGKREAPTLASVAQKPRKPKKYTLKDEERAANE
jgi:hypothetical protein